jgi:hypothetical protein
LKTAKWRGNPEATTKQEINFLFKHLKIPKNSIYYDLGCGYGNTCLWASKFVKLSVGIENHRKRYEKAIKNSISSKFPNVKIIKSDFENIPINEATVIYSTSIWYNDFVRINKETKPNTMVIVPDIPPEYPIKSKKVGRFFVLATPFSKVKNTDEYTSIFFGKKNKNLEDMQKSLRKDDFRRLKWYISREKSIWKKMNM